MNEQNRLIASLKKDGCRMTKLRQAMIGLFVKTSKPQSAAELLLTLLKAGISVNKTSVYRELEFLREKGVIRSVSISDQETLYERADDHHHHLVCRECKSVQDIKAEGVEPLLHTLEKGIARKNDFSDIHHSLEFFGRCGRCR